MIKLASLKSSLTNVAITAACAIKAPVTHLINSTFNSDMLTFISCFKLSMSCLVAKSALPCIGRYDGKNDFNTSDMTPAIKMPSIQRLSFSSPSMRSKRTSISRRKSLMSRLLAKSASPCASLKASAKASACSSSSPAVLSLRTNLWVSKVMVAIAVPSEVKLAGYQSSLTSAAITAICPSAKPIAHLTNLFSRSRKRESMRNSSSLSRLSSELLVTKLSRSYSCLACSSVDTIAAFCKRVIVSACWSLKPDDLSSLKNSCVSKLMAAIIIPNEVNYEGKKAFNTSEITPANIKPIIHLITAKSVRMGANSCWSLMSRCSLVTSSLRFTSRASDKASASASACLSGTPADLSLLANFSVSKVIVAMMIPNEIKLADYQSSLTSAATMPMEKAISAPSLMVKRCSIWTNLASISRRRSSISRCKSFWVANKSSLVTNSLRLTSSASAKTSASASACLSGTPAALSLLAYFKVSKVIAAISNPSYFNFYTSLPRLKTI